MHRCSSEKEKLAGGKNHQNMNTSVPYLHYFQVPISTGNKNRLDRGIQKAFLCHPLINSLKETDRKEMNFQRHGKEMHQLNTDKLYNHKRRKLWSYPGQSRLLTSISSCSPSHFYEGKFGSLKISNRRHQAASEMVILSGITFLLTERLLKINIAWPFPACPDPVSAS